MWRKLLLFYLIFLAGPTLVKADSITNNFDNSFDYFANGVAGSMWDGVYLGFGDVPGGNNGDGNNGYTLQANETAFPGYLTIQDSETDWSGNGDDGFYLYKVVAGDFDVSVENSQPFANPPYHFSGLLARAYTANGPHWGAPYGGAENWLNITRFNEYSIGDQVRYATNGNDVQISAPNNSGSPAYNSETGDNRYFRITRVGDTFTFYDRTNQTDTWVLEQIITRPDLHGVPMQVGIEDASFGSSTPTTYYTDFELTGTNVTAAITLPSSPTGLVATPSGNGVNYSWTPGPGSAGSILVLRRNNSQVLSQKPINGFTYSANTNFTSGDDIGGGIYVVYAGASSNVHVSGLGSTNNTYYAAVYSYNGSGSTVVYGSSPATTTNFGTGYPVSLNFTITPASGLPVGGVAIPILSLYDNIGDLDVVSNANATWFSNDNTILNVAADGTITGVGLGTATVLVTYNGLSVTNSITVHSPAYTNNFGASHNYLVNGLPGSTWDGIYVQGSDIPGASYAPPLANTTNFDANITSNNVLTISSINSAWQGANDNGPFLFKNVPGDFEVSVHITDYNIVNYQFVGLQARAFDITNNASPSGPGYAENFIDWLRFDEYGISTTTFNTKNGQNIETVQTDNDTSDYWLLMVRANATNFFFFKKTNLTDPWAFQPAETITRSDLTNGVPLQVGLVQATFTSAAGTVQFDSFALDAVNISGGTPPSATTGLTIGVNSSDTQATLTWTPGTNSDGSAATSLVVMRAGSPVSAQPYFGLLSTANSIFGQGTDLGGENYIVYRAVGNTVTVTGLTPGVSYYAVVYGYSGSSTTKSFNVAGSVSTNTPPVAFTGITVSLIGGSIPLNGIGLPVVIGQIQGGGTLDVTKNTQVISGNPSIIAATNGVLSGLAIGIATNTFSFVSGTNTLTASLITTVRAAGYADNFGTPHDYVANGITNTTWDGVYTQPGGIPGTTYSSDPAAAINDADANVTSNNVLNVTSENVGWEFAQNDGFFLFKNVAGDFQASVHISYLDSSYSYDGGSMIGYNSPGLLARAYGTNGSPYNGANGETWVSFTRFDEYGFGTYARETLANGTIRSPQSGGFNGANTISDTNLWLLIARQNGTNFLFFQRQLATDPWVPIPDGTTYSLTNFAGLPLQVGLLAGGFDSANQVTVGFDSFMLDQSTVAPVLSASVSAGNLSLSWPSTGNYTLQYTLHLTSSTWQPVNVPPVIANGFNTVTLPATNAAAFFRLTN